MYFGIEDYGFIQRLRGDNLTYYLRVYAILFKHTLQQEMQLPLKFLGIVCGGLIHFSVNILFFQAIYMSLGTQSINGWSMEEMRLLIATYNLSLWLYAFFAGNNLGSISNKVISGGLDIFLIKPVNSVFLLSFASVNLSAFFNMIWPVCLVIYQIINIGYDLSVINILGYLILVINGAILNYSITFITQILAFWVGRNKGIHIILSSVLQLAQYPATIYSKLFTYIFTYIFPIIVIANFPVKVLLMQNGIVLILLSTIITISVFALMLLLWHISVKRYTSAS